MEQYVITGVGVHNGLGGSAAASWENLLAGKSAITSFNWPEDDSTKFPATHSSLKSHLGAISPVAETYPELFAHDWPSFDRNAKACLASVHEAMMDSKITSNRVGVTINTFGGGTDFRLDLYKALDNGQKRYSPRKLLCTAVDFISAKIAGYYKLYGPNTSLNSACTSGLTGIDFAINTLKTDPDLDGMIVGGVDHLVEPIFMYWFQTLGALAISDDPSANCPFDVKRSGFVMGEGAATLIIEPMSKALARGANIYAIIRSTHLSTLYESDTSPDLSGDGAKLCVLKALEKAQVAASDISYINAHATSTPIGDKIEFDCVYSLMPGRVMVSNKGQLGHTMAGAGIVETIYTLMAMKHSTTPPNINLTDPLDTGMILPTSQMNLDIKYAIKNSFGFGGRNSSIVLERYDG